MRRLLLPFLAASLATSLAACTLSLPARQAAHDTAPAPAAIVQDAVTVTPLDAAPPPKPPEQPQPAPDPKPETPLSDANAEAKADAPKPAPPPEQLACEAKGGIWSATGASPLRTCLQPTRDAGKSCRKQSDCDGLCLARSRTCAPVKPLFGCNPILQEDGTEATLCID